MYNYLYTNDMRISDLPDSIKRVSEILLSGMEPYQVDKSFGNNGATIQFYFNLQDNTETLLKGKDATLEVIRNFILKFQFPNTRTLESFRNTLNDKILFAPYRAIISVLYKLALNESNTSHLTHKEILYFFFCNSEVCANPNFDIDKLINGITSYRNNPYDIVSKVNANIRWNQYERQLREMMTVLQYASSIFKNRAGTLSFVMPTSTDDSAFIHEVISYNRVWYPSNIEDFNLSNKEYISYMDTAKTPYYVIELDKSHKQKNKTTEEGLQQIFYGAPGTGKSNTIKREVDEKKKICFRTTFHPDSDYSTFVGCYKPTMKKQYRFDERMRSKDYEDGDLFGAKEDEIIIDKVIHYDFVPQAFTKAYVKAWQNPEEQVFLIIEEINRGNCAQIFGDIFQLLDRNDQGLSDYPIKADDDLKAHLYECFISNDNLPENIKSGEELQLPSNLYIWATMNTSDQSLFPIDSAFKRRWDWTYMPIYDAKKGWKIEVNGKRYGWWSFLEKINEKIGTTTSSEDKKLGYFFCKADDNGIISAEKFVGKVIFYLWNDVFKDYAEDSSVFVDEANKAITFDKFYMADSEGRAIVATNMVETFLKNLVVEADTSIEKDEEISSTNTTITVNGKAVKYVNAIPYTTIEEYKILHPNKTAQEIIDVWKDFSKYSMRTWIVCNKDEHEKMDARYANYSYKIDCADGESLWVNKDGWMYHPKNSELRDTISEFIKAVNEANLGIEIKETSIE